MPTSHFDSTALPPARVFYEQELGELRRPSRGWARPKAGCPFHESTSKASFAVNLNTGGFFCFSCGAKGGDVLDFLKLRGMDFKTAAKSLGAWRTEGLSNSEQRRLARERNRRKREQAAAEAQRESKRAQRIDAREWLRAAETLYDEAIAEHDWSLMSELLPRVRQFEELYWQLAGLEVRHER